MTRSTVVTAFGVLFTFLGLLYFFSPPANEFGEKVRDEYSLFISGWMIASGIGLLWHYRWALFVYLAGFAILLVYGLSTPIRAGVPFGQTIGITLVLSAMFGVPAVLLWLKREHLRAWSSKSESDA